jgi:pyruvate-formate lyase-activating enzyme
VNTKNVNSAAGVILAALTQNRTPAGIALALESAGLLMTPETAADMASVSTDAVAVAEKAVEELRREHAESARLRTELSSYEMLTAQQCQAGKHADWLVDSELAHACPWCQAEELRARVAELEALKPAPIQNAAKMRPR